MMLNDCMYGIIFRDINPRRTFIDQRFSRQIHARAGIVINTGEDNYLTTADAVDAAHTVVVSQLMNEFFGKEAGLADGQLGLGHAFEINPDVPDSFVLELAHAQLIRELFPRRPAEVHAADQAHDRQRVRRLPAGRVLQPGRGDDRPVDPADRHDDRGHPHPVPGRPGPGPGERPLRARRRRAARRELPARRPAGSSTAGQRGAGRGRRAAAPDHRRGPADRDRRRHLRHHPAPGRRRPRPGRRHRAGRRLRQPGQGHPRGPGRCRRPGRRS